MKQQTQPRLGPDAPLSKLLYETRPLLRPIIFTRSTATPFLFQYEEELLKPVVEDVETKENPVPTADRVAQVFNGMAIGDTDSDDEELEEIDFAEMQKLLEIIAKPIKLDQAAEEQFTGFYNPNIVAAAPSIAHQNEEAADEAVSDVPISNVGIVEIAEIPTTSLGCTDDLPTNPINVITPVAIPTLPTRTSDDVVFPTDVSGPAVTEVALQPDTAGLDNESPSPAANAPLLSHVEETADEETLPSVAPDAASFGIDITPTPPHTAISDSRDEPNLNNQVLDSIEPVEHEAFYVDATPPITLSIDAHSSQNHGATVSTDQTPEPPEAENFYIDTTPAPITATQNGEAHISRSLEAQVALGDEEEIIVYVAPHPRSGRATPAVVESPSTLRMISVLTGLSTIDEASQLSQTDKCLPGAGKGVATPATTASRFIQTQNPRQFVSPLLLASPSTHRKAKLRVRRHEARLAKRRKDTQSMFSLAAARQEMEWQDPEERDLRWEERRRGDSDIDWGDEDETKATQESAAASYAEEMDLDPDLLDEKSMNALGSFANAMLGQAKSNFMTMDDIADADKLREEDEASQGGAEGSSDEDELEEEAVRAALDDDSDEESEEEEELRKALEEEEEKMLPEEDNAFEMSDDDDEDETDDSSDDDLSPRSSFQARLDQLRKRSRKSRGKARDVSLDEDEEADFNRSFNWDDQGDLLQEIEELLDENGDILSGHDRKQKNRLFKAISNGNHDDLSEFTVAPRRKDKAKGLPASLQKQWEKDRAKKAKLKEARQMAQLEAASDPLAKKKGGKKGINAMLAAARADPKITVIGPNRIIDMTTLVQQIRRFLANPGGPQTMSLPPTSKVSRKLVHEMATAFNLKSQSKGKEDARYTTLIKTSRSGMGVDEKKVGQLLRRGQFAFGSDAWNESKNGKEKGKSGGGGGGGPRQKEGEEVGKAAPKIGSSNIGFKMLEAMGWSEGGRIGVTGGLEQPLTAIIKRSKLGLGATKAQ